MVSNARISNIAVIANANKLVTDKDLKIIVKEFVIYKNNMKTIRFTKNAGS